MAEPLRLPDGTLTRSVTRGTQRAAGVLAALGIKELDPPQPAPKPRVVTNRPARPSNSGRFAAEVSNLG
ncbi:MAG: hypothetical protein HY744_11670 [Deltaproteobacteria bacterium]|nr:hypothetical protein [Deltaproteobacteria bacterium]